MASASPSQKRWRLRRMYQLVRASVNDRTAAHAPNRS